MTDSPPRRSTAHLRDSYGPMAFGGNAIQHNHQRISGWSIAALCLGLGGFTIVSIPLAIVFAALAIAQIRKVPTADAPYAQPMGAMQPTGAPTVQPAAQPPGHAAEPTPMSTADTAWPAASPDSADATSGVTPDPVDATGAAADPVTSAAYAPPPAPPTPGGVYPAPEPGPVFQPDFSTAAAAAGYPAAKAVSIVFVVIAFFSSTIWAGVWTVAAVQAFQGDYGYSDEELALTCEPSPGYANVCTLASGDCFHYPGGGADLVDVEEVELIDCGSPHNAQAVGSFTASGTDWPGWDQLTADAEAQCWSIAEQNVDTTLISADTYVGFIAPNAASWEYGVHNVTCMVFLESGEFTTSVMN